MKKVENERRLRFYGEGNDKVGIYLGYSRFRLTRIEDIIYELGMRLTPSFRENHPFTIQATNYDFFLIDRKSTIVFSYYSCVLSQIVRY